MSDNTVFMIADKTNGSFFDIRNFSFVSKITFGCFSPSVREIERLMDSVFSSRQRKKFTIVEAQVVEFANDRLTVAYEDFSEKAPF